MDKEGSTLARPAAVLLDTLQQAVLPLQPQSVQDFGNGALSGAAVLAGTQNAVSHVLGLRFPLLRQGDMTDLFLLYTFGAICGSFCFLFEESIHCLLQGELLFIFLPFCGPTFRVSPVFVRTQGMYYRLCAGVWFIIFCFRFIFYWRCHFVQESFRIIFAAGAYDAPGVSIVSSACGGS